MCVCVDTIPQWFEDETEMILVVEMAIQAQTVKLVLRVGVVQSFQELQLLQTRLVPEST